MIIDAIPLSGPFIAHREIESAADAAATGWNAKESVYIQKFQADMCAFTGHRFAFATSSRAGALHLAMLALGIGAGDEVLVPEIADISVALCVVHAGAKPVFCDVEPQTLCLDPKSAEANITPATKAVIPVHMYGQPCDMDPILELAERRGLAVVEEATQGFGALYKGRRAGSFGLFTVYSFNAREAVVSGEGGMLLGSNEKLMARAVTLGTEGRSRKNPFVYEEAGFDYGMSNLQAALGSAQMERAVEILEKKHTIHTWYKERLSGVSGARLGAEQGADGNGRLSSCLMPVLFLENFPLPRTVFLQRLQASGVMCAPVPYPLSSMPMFAEADNPAAYGAGARALLLPGGCNRTEEEVEYVCTVVKALLADTAIPRAAGRLTGWLRYKSDILETFAAIKAGGLTLPFTHDGENYALAALTAEDATDSKVISFLADFRRENMHAFLRHHDVTDEFMRSVMSRYADQARDFLLFFVTRGDIRYGHMGLDDFNFQKRECVAEGFMMRKDSPRGLAAAASEAMYAWAKEKLGVTRVFNHVVGSNKPVRLLAASQGFREVNRTALYKKTVAGGAVFRPMYIMGHDQPDEHFVFSVRKL